MKRIAWLISVLMILCVVTAYAEKIKYQDAIIDRSGKPIAGATITVYNQGTTTKATLYSNSAGANLANPITADSSGNYWFYAETGRYDLKFSKTGYTTVTTTDVWVGGGTGITYCTGQVPTDGQVSVWVAASGCWKGVAQTAIVYCSGTPADAQYLQWNSSGSCFQGGTPTGAGNVIGGVTSLDGQVVIYSGGGGQTIKNFSGSGILKGNSGILQIATPGVEYADMTVSNGTMTGLISPATYNSFNSRLSPTGNGAGLTGITAAQTNSQPTSTNLTKLSSPNTWKIPYSDGSSVMQEMAFGAAGLIFTSNGPTSAPTSTNNINLPKSSGVAGRSCLYTAYSIDLFGVCTEGPANTMSADLVLKYPDGNPANSMISWGTPSAGASQGVYVPNTVGITLPVSIVTVTSIAQIPYTLTITRGDLVCLASSTASVAFSYAAPASSPTWTVISASQPLVVSNTTGTATNTTLTGWTTSIPPWSWIKAVVSGATGTCKVSLGGYGQ
jgi:hypothetical protein